MSTLKDYLDPATLQQLQDAFSAAAQVPIRICQPDEAAPGPESITPHEADGRGRFAAPIRLGAEVLGRVVLDSAGPGREEQKPGYLQLLADVIAGLCAGRKELRARVEELGTLYRLTAEFAGRRDLQEILETVAQTVVASLKAKACSIRLLSEDRTELVIKAVANLSEAYLDKGPILLSESRIDQQVLSTGKCVYIADSRSDPRVLYPAEASREGIVSALCAPLVYKGRAEGAIRVYMASRHEFDWFEVSLLEAIAAQAAAAIVNARLYHQAIRSANMSRA
ncbi:unnamed protein product, partial [marine sediment metagenome]